MKQATLDRLGVTKEEFVTVICVSGIVRAKKGLDTSDLEIVATAVRTCNPRMNMVDRAFAIGEATIWVSTPEFAAMARKRVAEMHESEQGPNTNGQADSDSGEPSTQEVRDNEEDPQPD